MTDDPLEKIVATHVEFRRNLVDAFDGYAFVRNGDGSLDHEKVALEMSERLNAQLQRAVTQLMMAREAEDQVQDPPPVEPDPPNPHDPHHVPAQSSSPPQGSDHDQDDEEDDTHEVTRTELFLAKHPKLEDFVEKMKPKAAKLWRRFGHFFERWITP